LIGGKKKEGESIKGKGGSGTFKREKGERKRKEEGGGVYHMRNTIIGGKENQESA